MMSGSNKRTVEWSAEAVLAASEVLAELVPAGTDVVLLARRVLDAGRDVDFPPPPARKYGRPISKNPCRDERRQYGPDKISYCDLDAGHLDEDPDGYHEQFEANGSSLWRSVPSAEQEA
jgi:hypothetical protein